MIGSSPLTRWRAAMDAVAAGPANPNPAATATPYPNRLDADLPNPQP
jgi:hypothetical protein